MSRLVQWWGNEELFRDAKNFTTRSVMLDELRREDVASNVITHFYLELCSVLNLG